MFRRHLDMTSEIKTRGSLLDPADSNNGLNDPENDGGRFLKRPRTHSEGRSAERPPERLQPVLAKRPPKRPGPHFEKRGPRRGPPTPSKIRMYHTLVVTPAFLAIFTTGPSATVLQ
jgi:hypothetical protein